AEAEKKKGLGLSLKGEVQESLDRAKEEKAEEEKKQQQEKEEQERKAAEEKAKEEKVEQEMKKNNEFSLFGQVNEAIQRGEEEKKEEAAPAKPELGLKASLF
ncbi:hypothetical protein TVAGG3_1016490, partial [Trichomonas vaginalis G3]|uniref:hypothetical protein n=1 Tax=Trichomonas vaginalis (strain ATCC PRA-98 / G3) TaxID=412133 RepID=UPI0021E5C714